MTQKCILEVEVTDPGGAPVDLEGADVTREESGIVVEKDGVRQVALGEDRITKEISRMGGRGGDLEIHVIDRYNDNTIRVDVPKISEVKDSYAKGEIGIDELEAEVMDVLNEEGDPEGVFDW